MIAHVAIAALALAMTSAPTATGAAALVLLALGAVVAAARKAKTSSPSADPIAAERARLASCEANAELLGERATEARAAFAEQERRVDAAERAHDHALLQRDDDAIAEASRVLERERAALVTAREATMAADADLEAAARAVVAAEQALAHADRRAHVRELRTKARADTLRAAITPHVARLLELRAELDRTSAAIDAAFAESVGASGELQRLGESCEEATPLGGHHLVAPVVDALLADRRASADVAVASLPDGALSLDRPGAFRRAGNEVVPRGVAAIFALAGRILAPRPPGHATPEQRERAEDEARRRLAVYFGRRKHLPMPQPHHLDEAEREVSR